MTKVRKELLKFEKSLIGEKAFFGSLSFANVNVADMEREDLEFLCNILGSDIFSAEHKIKLVVEID
jgi:hypothetical protein